MNSYTPAAVGIAALNVPTMLRALPGKWAPRPRIGDSHRVR